MSHIELTHEVIIVIDAGEDFRNRILSFGTLTEHVFIARLSVELDTGNTRSFLTTVMLFLHHQIEFVKSIQLRAVFVLVIVKRLQQAYHRHTAFVFELFHIYFKKGANRH